MTIDENSRIRDLLQNPIGNDILTRLSQYMGLNISAIDNPLVRGVRLSSLPKLSGGLLDDGMLNAFLELCNDSMERVEEKNDDRAWWKEAVVYQIYPRSFMDSNGDGIGDLRGVIDRLDYLEMLGVSAIWLSPVYDSPNDDNGYDVRDYRKIMTEFGTMADMDELIERAHAKGIRLIMDMVLNHSSDEHEWFQKSKAGDPAYRDYYIWREAVDGNPPNNWRSFFSGSAWTKYAERDAWALHLFSKKQMDFNWENPDVRHDLCAIVAFWRGKGIDGFRFDVVNLISKSSFADGNEMLGKTLGLTGFEHYFYGKHLHEYLRQLRSEGLYNAFAVGETAGTGPEMNKLLTAPSRRELDMDFCFDHLDEAGKNRFMNYRYDLAHLKKCFLTYQGEFSDYAWPSIFVENHDNPRMISKIDPSGLYDEKIAKLLAMLLLTARGTVFLYQGQEIGMQNVSFSDISELRDVEAINRFHEQTEAGVPADTAFAEVRRGTRDHARVPMQWSDARNAGFTAGTPWIRTGDASNRNVAAEKNDPESILSFHRILIALRRDTKTLVYGRFSCTGERSRRHFCYFRLSETNGYYIETNLTADTICRPKKTEGMRLVLSNYGNTAKNLRPYEANLYQVEV